MKFVKEMTPKGLQIPTAALKLCGFEPEDSVELHTSADALVVLKQRMTAMELIHAAQHLHDLSVELHTQLAKACGACEECEGGCPYDDMEGYGSLELPGYLRREAGIPEDAKLCAWADRADNTVHIAVADFEHDLTDVPPTVLEIFAETGMCIGELEEHIMSEDIVYGQ